MARSFAFRLSSLILCASIGLAAGSAYAVSIGPGDILVSGTTSTGEGIFRVDPLTGNQHVVASGAFEDFAVSGDRIFALESGAVVEVSTVTGTKTVVSSGSFSGIAVGALGRLFVTTADTVVEIDRITGVQSLAFSGGLFDVARTPEIRELESDPMGDLIVLNSSGRGGPTQQVFKIDIETGLQALLLSEGDAGADFLGTTGLFGAPDGDIFSADGDLNSTFVVQLDAQTGIAATIATVDILTSNGSGFAELVETDVAIDAEGNLLLVGDPLNFGGTTIESGIFVNNLADDNGYPFSPGRFNEIQVIAPVPEPLAALLVIVGGFSLGTARRRRRL